MLKINYYLGLNDKDTNTQLFDVKTAHALIAIVLNNHQIHGATLYDVSGLWMGDSENTVVIEIVMNETFVNQEWLASVGYALRGAFNQASVMMTTTKLETVNHFDYV